MSNPLFSLLNTSSLTAALAFFCVVSLSGNDCVLASCGDYLLVGHGNSHLIASRQSSGSSQPFDMSSHEMFDDVMTTADSRVPTSPCALGGCRQSSIPALPESPGRAFYWKPFALVCRSLATKSDRYYSRWGRVGDDEKALRLILAAEFRPPEFLFSSV